MTVRLIKQTVTAVILANLVLTSLFFISLKSAAQASNVTGISAADYVAMDLQARQLTLEGVRDRLALLQLNAGLDAQLEQDTEIQQDIDVVYQQYNMTAASAIAWATKNNEVIKAWLANNPSQQAEYDRIARELDAVSTQIQALMNTQQD